MRRTFTRPATAIVALILGGAMGCAAARPSSTPQQAAQTAGVAGTPSSQPSSAALAGVVVTQAAFNEDTDGARVVLSADAPLLYTSYEPRPDLLVVDLPGAGLHAGFVPPAGSGSLVTAIRFEPGQGRQVTLIPFRGKRIVQGFNGAVMGALD